MPVTAAGSPIIVEPGSLDRLGAHVGSAVHRVAIITDTNVGPLYATRARMALAAFNPVLITIPAGETHKTRDTWAHVSDELLAQGLGRDTTIVALGGGVVGDLAGFVAATYFRGVPVVQVPTSLVAMIDASIGGKTGVDTPAGKNLIGAFHPPAAVVVDPRLLNTLPVREVRSGLAEALKHGAIADAAYFDRVAQQKGDIGEDLIARSIGIKAEVVNEDPREAGRRKILNFGHTLGHAIEAASGYALTHGESIAIGMVLEARVGEQLGVTAAGTAERIARALEALGLPMKMTLGPADLIARTYTDKKARGGLVEYAIPAEIGRFATWTTPVSDGDALRVLRGTID
ncbi:MAG TPA: 3-dehydroquinate synthase [Gemmatimonadaceae bacterium]|nr:3-dehydroquinate synthase [Gemmatimonadaceae bacterium]